MNTITVKRAVCLCLLRAVPPAPGPLTSLCRDDTSVRCLHCSSATRHQERQVSAINNLIGEKAVSWMENQDQGLVTSGFKRELFLQNQWRVDRRACHRSTYLVNISSRRVKSHSEYVSMICLSAADVKLVELQVRGLLFCSSCVCGDQNRNRSVNLIGLTTDVDLPEGGSRNICDSSASSWVSDIFSRQFDNTFCKITLKNIYILPPCNSSTVVMEPG